MSVDTIPMSLLALRRVLMVVLVLSISTLLCDVYIILYYG